MMQVVLSTKILTCVIGHSTLHNKFLESINISGILRYTIYEHVVMIIHKLLLCTDV